MALRRRISRCFDPVNPWSPEGYRPVTGCHDSDTRADDSYPGNSEPHEEIAKPFESGLADATRLQRAVCCRGLTIMSPAGRNRKSRHNGGSLCSFEPACVRFQPHILLTMTVACCAGQRMSLRRLWRRPCLSLRRRRSPRCAPRHFRSRAGETYPSRKFPGPRAPIGRCLSVGAEIRLVSCPWDSFVSASDHGATLNHRAPPRLCLPGCLPRLQAMRVQQP